MDVLVLDEGVGTNVVSRHHPVQETMSVGEISKEVDRARNGRCKVKNEMSDHHHVCGISHGILCPIDVGPQTTSNTRVQIWCVPCKEDGGVEIWISGKIECFKPPDGFLIVVLSRFQMVL